MSQIDELEARLGTLATLILPPLRASKHLNAQALDDLNHLVADMIREIGDSPMIPRRLVGTLWFIFTQMLTEADHTRSPEDILRSAWHYQEQLQKLFGPWYGTGQPTPGVPRY